MYGAFSSQLIKMKRVVLIERMYLKYSHYIYRKCYMQEFIQSLSMNLKRIHHYYIILRLLAQCVTNF